MKKLATLVFIISVTAVAATAQGRFGIKGGLNFNSLKDVSQSVDDTWSKQTGHHIGLTYQAKIPFIGLGIQPELLFERRRSENSMGNTVNMDYLTLPINVQIGLDLLLFRPFIMAGPYLSYAIGKGDMLANVPWDDINRLDYGYMLGAGVDIWRLQVSGKYMWGQGKLQDAGSQPLLDGNSFDKAKMEGFHLSVAWMF